MKSNVLNKYNRVPPFSDPVVTNLEWMSFMEVAERLANTVKSERSDRARRITILKMLGQGIIDGIFTQEGRHNATFFPPEECFYGQDIEISPADFQRLISNQGEELRHLTHIWAPIELVESWAAANGLDLWAETGCHTATETPRKTPPEKKARKRGLDYTDQDAPLLEKMHAMLLEKKATSPEDAARAFCHMAVGNGKESSKVARLAQGYRRQYQR